MTFTRGLFTLIVMLFTFNVFAQEKSLENLNISFKEELVQGLVGNGKSLLKTQHNGFISTRENKSKGHFIYSSEGKELDLISKTGQTVFFPGGVIYSFSKFGKEFEVFHTALKDDAYVVFIRFQGNDGDINIKSEIAFKKETVRVNNFTCIKFSRTGLAIDYTWDELKNIAIQPYAERGMTLECPSEDISKAVAFNQYLIDLAYNGELIICELFRWRDIWSRDLGSGFAPGALYSNRIAAAKNCITYDLARYEKATAPSLKTTKDASKGGSAEGTTFLTMSIWDYYLLTGDIEYLKSSAKAIRPWVEAWLNRDYNKDGLIIDVTEWMDHSRHYLLSYGSSTLYSNSLMVTLLKTFSNIEKEIGNSEAALIYANESQRFTQAINDKLWSPELNLYANLYLNGSLDQRSSSAANALAVLSGVASPNKVQKIFASLEKTNWKPAGSMTITPLMTHIDSDQNEHIWPWWNAVEARARFLNNDADGGIRLLNNCASTINHKKFPGLMEELMERDGKSTGGNAFTTAAGSFLTTVYKGLFGIEILKAGMEKIQIAPNLPDDWKSAELKVPTKGGSFTISIYNGKTTIDVSDKAIKEVAVKNGVVVNGAKAVPIVEADNNLTTNENFSPLEPLEIIARNAVVFEEEGLTNYNYNIPLKRIHFEELSNINQTNYTAVVFMGSRVPAFSNKGEDMRKILEEYTNNGGAVIFYGITMEDKHKEFNSVDNKLLLGFEGGVIEWYKIDEKSKPKTWVPIDIKTGETLKSPIRGGTVYWGAGDYFNSWDLKQGMFGFAAKGRGALCNTNNALLNKKDILIGEVFTDFTVSAPWYFHSLADTKTEFNFLNPQKGEKLSCFSRIVNMQTKGEYILLARSLAKEVPVENIFKVLKIPLSKY